MARGYIQNGEVVIKLESVSLSPDCRFAELGGLPYQDLPNIPHNSEFNRPSLLGVRLSRSRAGFCTQLRPECNGKTMDCRYGSHKHVPETTWAAFVEVSQEWESWVFDNKVIVDDG